MTARCPNIGLQFLPIGQYTQYHGGSVAGALAGIKHHAY